MLTKVDKLLLALWLLPLANGGDAALNAGGDERRIILFVTGISDGSCLAVVAEGSCDVGLVAYEMTVLVERAGAVLTPELRMELQGALPR